MWQDWVWVNSGSWWWTGRPGVLRFMGSQRVRHDWVTELNWVWRCQNGLSILTLVAFLALICLFPRARWHWFFHLNLFLPLPHLKLYFASWLFFLKTEQKPVLSVFSPQWAYFYLIYSDCLFNLYFKLSPWWAPRIYPAFSLLPACCAIYSIFKWDLLDLS